jgi:GT2 family glycosyltransferase
LCWRLKRAGYKIMVCPQSVVYHVGGGTLDYQTPYKTYLNFRNTLFTMLKNEPLKRLLWLAPTRLALDGLAAGLFLFQGKFKHIASIARAHWSFFTRLPRTWKSRGRSASQARRAAVAPRPNSRGRYPGSVVWQYYARGRKCFQQLPGMKNYIDP